MTSLSNTGVISVVTITRATIAGKREASTSPACSPFGATIRATSPREIMPTPIRRDSWGV